MKCTAALAGVLALAMLLTGCKKPVDTVAATAETTDETAATPNPVEALPASVTVGTVLPKTEAAGRSYIDETLFIGDSNTARYLMYADETGTAFTTLANNIGVVSMGAGAITTLKCEQFSVHHVHGAGRRGDAEAQTHHHLLWHEQSGRVVHRCNIVYLYLFKGTESH